jgi:hypothetical protein
MLETLIAWRLEFACPEMRYGHDKCGWKQDRDRWCSAMPHNLFRGLTCPKNHATVLRLSPVAYWSVRRRESQSFYALRQIFGEPDADEFPKPFSLERGQGPTNPR